MDSGHDGRIGAARDKEKRMDILLVDDEPVQLRGLCRYVRWEELGYKVPDCAASAKDAIKMVQEKNYDIVITDVTMPEMSGLEMIEYIHRKLEMFPVFVILSGYDEFKYAQEAIRQGVRFYVLKPVKVKEIEEVLKTVWLERTIPSHVGAEADRNSLIQSKFHPVIFQILQFIDREYANNITIQTMAERFAINGSYLSSLFKKEMGMNFGAYLTKVRMRKALELMGEGKYRVSEIAERVGYQTSSYFSEQFKKEYGCNPKDYKF